MPNEITKAKLTAINSVVKTKKTYTRGRYPECLIKALEIFANAYGYEKGLTIEDFAQKLYGIDTFHNRTKARQILSQIRKHWEIFIYSIKPLTGGKRKYCHLQNPKEFQQVINEYTAKRDGIDAYRKLLKKKKHELIKSEKIIKVRS